ncbi:unnamed protein product [Candida verbasci]|uniref:Uncharacterized protein n=1 Tax=Candida verbasci TaxID=1227364 RepID=A0A9W4TVV4_9ASCO|nr:unnamed protein product [Candida verbasci]
MSDYGGLGIVLEEVNNHQVLNNSPDSDNKSILSKRSIQYKVNNNSCTTNTISRQPSDSNISVVSEKPILESPEKHQPEEYIEYLSNSNSEILLPPLPDAIEDLNTNISNYIASDGDNQSTTTSTSNHDNISSSASFTSDEFQIYNNKSSSFSNYQLDSPNLLNENNNNKLTYFPSVSTQVFNDSNISLGLNTTTPTPMTSTTNSASNNSTNPNTSFEKTSPLKKLKSLKRGIRKLSLSSISNNIANSSASSSSNSTPTTPKFSTLSNTSTQNTSLNIRPSLSPIQAEEVKTNHQYHQHSSSSSTSTVSSLTSSLRNTNTNKRNRTLSQGTTTNFSPVTPPPLLTSPIITISENLSTTKKTMSSIEANYFDSLQNSNKNSIEELNDIDELINYSSFLRNQKLQLIDIFNKTREKLEKSGWCSQTDFVNLGLQQDSSSCQIDTILLKIENKLNKDFNYSILNNEVKKEEIQVQTQTHGFISPSLRTLESKCNSFTNF